MSVYLKLLPANNVEFKYEAIEAQLQVMTVNFKVYFTPDTCDWKSNYENHLGQAYISTVICLADLNDYIHHWLY